MRRYLLTLLCFAFLCQDGLTLEVARVIEGRPLVVELFTSQGCSSCPPADELLTQISQKRDVIALSQHVDYWNYIGWKDPFSSKQTSDRQRLYALRMGRRGVYTPQMIMGGNLQELGNSPRKVSNALNLALRPTHEMKVTFKGDKAYFQLEKSEQNFDRPLTLWVAELNYRRVTKIGRGENGGKSLTYSHIVREFYPVAQWNGESTEHSINLQELWDKDRDGIAVIVQEGKDFTGPIRAAAALFITDS